MESQLVIIALVFAATLFFVVGLYSFLKQRNRQKELVQRLRQNDEPHPGPADSESFPVRGVKDILLLISGYLGKYTGPKSEDDLTHLERKALKAGIRSRNFINIMYGAKAACALALPLVFSLLKFAASRPMPVFPFMSIMVFLAVLGFYIPNIWLHLRIKMRKQKILESFPDALDLLVICVESGMSLDSAITRVGEELRLGHKVLSEEFKLLNLELRAGKSRRDALRNFGLRSDLDEVNSLVTLLIQTDKFGTSIAQALRVYSDSMRTSRYQRAEEMAVKLPVKLIVPLMLFIFPSLFIVIMGPAMIQIFRIWSSR